MKFAYSLRDLISVPPLAKSMRSNYQLISTNLLDLFELKTISWPKRDFPVDGSSDSEDDNGVPLPRFKKKSPWNPTPSKNTTLESFIVLVKIDVQRAASTNIPTHNNLTPAEKGAIQELKERDDIVMKPLDKGSAVVVMDKVDYLEEANRQVTDERFYKKTGL